MAAGTPRLEASRAEVFLFIGLVLGVSWTRFVPPVLHRTASLDVPEVVVLVLTIGAAFSPLIGALALVARRGGTARCVAFLRSGLQWHVAPVWYLVAFFLLPVLFGSALLVFVLRGGTIPTVGEEALLDVLTIFTVGVVFNISENFGWRGYLQAALQRGHTAFFATVSVGAVWGLWHAPLFLPPEGPLSGIPFRWYFVLVLAISVLFGWLYNETEGSVLLVTLMHCAFNAVIGTVVFALMSEGIDVTPYVAVCAVVAWLAAAVVLVRNGSRSLTGVPAARP